MSEQELPTNAIIMLEFLQNEGRKTQKEVISTLKLPIRSVRYCIRRLLEKQFILKYPNLKDMRSVYYQLNPDHLAEVENLIEGTQITA